MDEVRKECVTVIPDNFDYSKLKNASAECKENLRNWRPQNLAAASRLHFSKVSKISKKQLLPRVAFLGTLLGN